MIANFTNVTKRYRTGEGIRDINFEIPQGQVIGLLGLNGSGKTTTMKILSGLLTPGKGEASILGMNPRQGRSNVAFLGDRQGFPYWMAPKDMERFVSAIYSDFDTTKFARLREELGVPNKALGEMSRGQQQKLKLAVTMARTARLYLLDEPLSGIDLVARTGILKGLISNWNENSSVIIATHEIKDVEPFLDRAIFLTNGTIIKDEMAEDIRNEGVSVADRFLQLMGGDI